MLIKLDTGVMFELANYAKTACQYVEESSQVAYQIVPHNDWNCKERDYINDGIETIRKYQARISEKMSHFSGAISQVATAFQEAEASLPNLFNEVDACVGEILSVGGVKSADIGAETQKFIDQIKDTTLDADRFQSIAATMIDSPLEVCDFSSIDMQGGAD